MMFRFGAAAAVATMVTLAPPARAQDERAACIASHESAQQQRQLGKLVAAKKELERCSRSDCPAPIAADCSAWWTEVQQALPSVIVTAPKGAEVRIDDELVDPAAVDREKVLDPGAHTIRATLADHQPFEQRIELAKGARGVPVTVTFAPLPAAPPTTAATTPPVAEPVLAEGSGPSVATWVVGGVGLAGLAVFGGFAISGMVRRSDLEDAGCKPSCSTDDVSAMSRDFLVADVALAVGLTGLVVATVLYLTTGDGPAPATGGATATIRDAAVVLTF